MTDNSLFLMEIEKPLQFANKSENLCMGRELVTLPKVLPYFAHCFLECNS